MKYWEIIENDRERVRRALAGVCACNRVIAEAQR